MTEHGMLFSAPMVRALLEGHKTQTRRPMKPQPRKNSVGQWLWGKNHVAFWPEIDNYGPLPTLCPYGKVGDRIWVRETFADLGPRYAYRASRPDLDVRWTPSIHMPRLASRITLEITEVRVQRLQEISEEDAQAEGLTANYQDGIECSAIPQERHRWHKPHRAFFSALWESTYGPGSWDRNDWVWALTFKVVK